MTINQPNVDAAEKGEVYHDVELEHARASKSTAKKLPVPPLPIEEESSNYDTDDISLNDVDNGNVHEDNWNEINQKLLKKIYKHVRERSGETSKASDNFKWKNKWSGIGVTAFITCVSIISFVGVNEGLSDSQKNGFLIAAGVTSLIGTALINIRESLDYPKKDLVNSIMSQLYSSQAGELQGLIYSPSDARGDVNQVISTQQKNLSQIGAISYNA